MFSGHNIKLTFSETILLSFKMRLITLLNMPQEMSNVNALIALKSGISFEEVVYRSNKQIINEVT